MNGDLRSTRLNKKWGTKKLDAKAWEAIYDDFLAKVPRSDDFTEFLQNLVERAEIQAEFILSLENGVRNRRLLNQINELTNKIQNYHMKGKAEKSLSITKMLNIMSKEQGYQLRIKDLTTLAYFELINSHNNG
jgi:hypothetical protein